MRRSLVAFGDYLIMPPVSADGRNNREKWYNTHRVCRWLLAHDIIICIIVVIIIIIYALYDGRAGGVRTRRKRVSFVLCVRREIDQFSRSKATNGSSTIGYTNVYTYALFSASSWRRRQWLGRGNVARHSGHPFGRRTFNAGRQISKLSPHRSIQAYCQADCACVFSWIEKVIHVVVVVLLLWPNDPPGVLSRSRPSTFPLPNLLPRQSPSSPGLPRLWSVPRRSMFYGRARFFAHGVTKTIGRPFTRSVTPSEFARRFSNFGVRRRYNLRYRWPDRDHIKFRSSWEWFGFQRNVDDACRFVYAVCYFSRCFFFELIYYLYYVFFKIPACS